jgi:hypothetical protein
MIIKIFKPQTCDKIKRVVKLRNEELPQDITPTNKTILLVTVVRNSYLILLRKLCAEHLRTPGKL